METQRHVMRNTKIECRGRMLTVAQWAEESGQSVKTIVRRLNCTNWPVERCIYDEVRPTKSESERKHTAHYLTKRVNCRVDPDEVVDETPPVLAENKLRFPDCIRGNYYQSVWAWALEHKFAWSDSEMQGWFRGCANKLMQVYVTAELNGVHPLAMFYKMCQIGVLDPEIDDAPPVNTCRLKFDPADMILAAG